MTCNRCGQEQTTSGCGCSTISLIGPAAIRPDDCSGPPLTVITADAPLCSACGATWTDGHACAGGIPITVVSWAGRERCDKCRWWTLTKHENYGVCHAIPQGQTCNPDWFCASFSPLPTAVPEGKARWET